MKTPKMTIAALTLITLAGCGQAPTLSIDATTLASQPTATNPAVDPLPGITPAAVPTATPTATPTSTPSPLPPPTVVSYAFNNSIGICDAVRNWNPTTTTVVFPTNSGGAFIFTFAATGVKISNADGSGAGNYTGTITKAGILNAPPVCVITINAGSMTGIQ